MDAIASWLEVGGTWADFWTLTPWQTVEIIRAKRDAVTIAAHKTASLSGAAQAGKLQPVERYLSRKAEKAAQSPEDILSGFDRFADAHEKARKHGGRE